MLHSLALKELKETELLEYEQSIHSVAIQGEFLREFPTIDSTDWGVQDREISLGKKIEIFFYTLIVYLATMKACSRKEKKSMASRS